MDTTFNVSNGNKKLYLAQNRSYEQIRQGGAISSLNSGPLISIHGIETRLIAWPGNGFQTESVHIETFRPGQEFLRRAFTLTEKAMLCLKGMGEVYLRGQWVTIEEGDIAYIPAGVEHAIQNSPSNTNDLVLVSTYSPPPFDLYDPDFYDSRQGIMKFQAIQEAMRTVPQGKLSPDLAFHIHENLPPEVCAWNLSPQEIAQRGALFNVFRGAQAGALVSSMVFILWPGYGTRLTGYNSAYIETGERSIIHKHPISDECLINFGGGTVRFYCGDQWIEANPLECVLAPCGVIHGAEGIDGRALLGGWASPPQVDVYAKTPLYHKGYFRFVPFEYLK